MLKIPYGKSDFKTIIEEEYFYQDRTHYIQTLENWDSTYLLYLRPRRFGKSLFISTLHYYYGMEFQAAFPMLFGKTFMGQHPTKKANAYLVLRFDFSGINTETEQDTYDGFLSNVLKGCENFIIEYKQYFSIDSKKEILTQKKPNEMIKSLLHRVHPQRLEQKVYILIDEYDHFANQLIAFNYAYFLDIVTQNGYVRTFYEVLKMYTGTGLVERIFITGVSPVTMDSLTSGFNISTNISLSKTFHQMVGFEQSEVESILVGLEIPQTQLPQTLKDLRLWYNGYLFCADLEKRLYNPSMVFYFAAKYAESNAYPRTMLDPNIATDYSKIQNLFNIQGNAEQYLGVLRDLLEKGAVSGLLTDQYSFKRGFTRDDLVSLLFYMGFLTIQKEHLNRYTFTFPNYVIKKLYADYFFNSILQKEQLPFSNTPVNEAIEEMAQTGNPKPFFEQVKLVLKYFSTRDAAHFNENTLKSIIISLLHQQGFYYIHSEYETNWAYMDVYLEAIRGQKPNFEVAMELKYVQKGGKKAVDTLLKAAKVQLQGYLDTPKFNTRTNLKSFVVVVAGDKLEWRAI
jgi:Predicted AAA-ATPase/PD-(D/E)XK nuclease superfamily